MSYELVIESVRFKVLDFQLSRFICASYNENSIKNLVDNDTEPEI